MSHQPLSIPSDRFDPRTLQATLSECEQPVPLLKRCITEVSEFLNQQFTLDTDIHQLVTLRAQFIDQLLAVIWNHFEWPAEGAALVAVGGYGRGELHPHSDIDLLLLLTPELRESRQCDIEQLISLLWDIKLDIGHSVRTVEECIKEASREITVVTNLMESRLLAGDPTLHDAVMAEVGPEKIWPSKDFFNAKWQEQIDRHHKYADTEYNLEPNLKSSPGGLRDIQMIGWVAKRHFGVTCMDGLVELGFLQDEDLSILKGGLEFLWQVRYALHLIAGREEDRLLFDHQRALAKLFGYEDDDARLAVERFMQRYYRTALALGELNELLMQHFDEAIVRACEPENVLELNARFRVRNSYIEVANDKVFENYPSALLEVFVLLSQNSHITGVRASTVRLIRDHRELINDAFRADPRNTRLFMELLRSQHKISVQLKRMKRYGILGKYLPEFGRIIGQMQHDLFHIYTVDAHTLDVVKNMRRFQHDDMREQFPVASRILRRMEKRELLYIAGLYHDIAKGRGGDHSMLGSRDARNFCQRHGLSRRDTNLVVWLVEHHLLMSSVSQRKDITDPDVIREFALEVGDQLHLDYIYVLTVADINATNPTLWNNWRASLLRQLYAETKRALRRGLENPIDRQEWIEETQEAALERLQDMGFEEDEIEQIWASFSEDYFLRERVEDVVWHTEAIAQNGGSSEPIVLIKKSSELNFESASQIFVHTPRRGNLFALLASAMEQLDLNIQDARIYDPGRGFSLDTFYVLDADNQPLGDDSQRIKEIRQFLRDELRNPDQYLEIMQRRTPRQMRLFSIPTRTTLTIDEAREQSVLEVISPDRPGLLARIGKIFFNFGIELQNAKITTLGERVEDVFFITDQDQQPIRDPELQQQIQKAICRELDEQAEQ